MYLPPYLRDIHGTAFPANPIERELFYRDDLHIWFIYNGAAWVDLQAPGMVIHGNAWHAPAFATQAALAAHIAATAAGTHGSAVLATPDLLIHRDAAGRAQIANPLANPDIDNLGSRNAAIAIEAAARAAADAAEAAARAAADAAHAAQTAVGTHGSAVLATPDRLVHRDAAGRSQIANPVANPEIDNLGSRNAAIAAHTAIVDAHHAPPRNILDVYLFNGGVSQVLPSGQRIVAMLDTEVIDLEGAFDPSVKTGTATATVAFRLVDNVLNPFVPGDVGRLLWNTTDNTYTYITGYVSASTVIVNANIFTIGEGYHAYFARWTAPSAMELIVFVKIDVRVLGPTNYCQLQILRNGATAASELRYFSGAGQIGLVNMSRNITVAAGDHIQMDVAQNTGANQLLNAVAVPGPATYMGMVKLRDL